MHTCETDQSKVDTYNKYEHTIPKNIDTGFLTTSLEELVYLPEQEQTKEIPG